MRDDRELTPEQLAAFGAELDALHLRTLADLGADDARYIRRVRAAVRVCCWSGRALLMFGWLPPTWLLGSLLLGLGKILENMELGHNVMHGQYDWMNDPEFAGRAYEWDIAGPSDFWRHTHNHIHHTYTNVLGKDDDVGYGVVRLFPEQRWKPFYRWQPLWVTLQALLFQYAVAIQHLRLDKYAKGRLDKAELMPLLRRLRAKLGRQWTKDYLLFPLLGLFAGGFGAVFVGNLLANVLRNLWTFTVIFCGHFTEKAVVFPPSVLEGETRAHLSGAAKKSLRTNLVRARLVRGRTPSRRSAGEVRGQPGRPCQCLPPIMMKRSWWVIFAAGIRCGGRSAAGGSISSGRVAKTVFTTRSANTSRAAPSRCGILFSSARSAARSSVMRWRRLAMAWRIGNEPPYCSRARKRNCERLAPTASRKMRTEASISPPSSNSLRRTARRVARKVSSTSATSARPSWSMSLKCR